MTDAPMKPEYSYSHQKHYNFWLGISLAGKNPEAVFKVLHQRVPAYQNMTYAEFASDRTIVSYHLYDEAIYYPLRAELEAAGAIIRMSEYDNYTIAPAGIGLPQRELTELREFSLALWAEAHQIREAYRMCFSPSFKPTVVRRLWFDGEVRLANRLQRGSLAKWSNLQGFMGEHFWTDEDWNISRLVFDGISYTFEGWKEGAYKVKRANTPQPEDIAYHASELINDFFNPVK